MTNETIVLFPNTTATERYSGERFIGWHVSADPGYVMHEITHDMPVYDEDYNETGEIIPGYTRAAVFVQYNYDFESNPRLIYAQLESEIPDPDNQIHSGDNNDHEVASTQPEEPAPINE